MTIERQFWYHVVAGSAQRVTRRDLTQAALQRLLDLGQSMPTWGVEPLSEADAARLGISTQSGLAPGKE